MRSVYSKTFTVILYVISMVVAFTTRIGNYNLGFKLQIPIGLLWIGIAIAQMAMNKFKFKGTSKEKIPFFLKIYLLPCVVIHLYTIVLMILGEVDWAYLGTNLTVYVPTILAVISVYLFDVDSLKYNFVALCLSWVLSILTALVTEGFHIIPDAIMQAYFGVKGIKNYFELHDLVLSIGYFFVFYIFSSSKLTKQNFAMLSFSFLILVLGMKRITVLGLLVSIIFALVLKTMKSESQYKMCKITGFVAFFLCYGFIYILRSGSPVYEWLHANVALVSSRNYYYETIMALAEFKIDFLGIGRNVVTELLTTEYAYLRVGGVHSDIIKMFVENGFIMFGFWLWYYLIHIPRSYQSYFGYKAAVMYFAIEVYIFMLYLTDNVEIYFISQIFHIIIPITCILKLKNEEKEISSISV